MAFYFTVDADRQEVGMLAILETDLWDSASKEFHLQINWIHYSHDYEISGGNAFMDDYGLC